MTGRVSTSGSGSTAKKEEPPRERPADAPERVDGFTYSASKSLFATATVSLLSFGIFVLFLPLLPQNATGTAALYMLLMLITWIRLHGRHLSRQQRIYFDEASILMSTEAITPKTSNVDSDCDTPANGPGSREVPAADPMTLLQYLFADEREIEQQKFYKQHYGGMFERATRAQKNAETLQAKPTPSKSSATSSSQASPKKP
ncbi:unnamed protein product, partial [Mesorhabditis spiculigera]